MTEKQALVNAGSKKDRTILLAGLIAYGIGQSLLYIIFAPIGQRIGMPAWQIGTVISVSNLGILFAAPFWGRKSDVIGRRKVLVIGLIGFGFGYFGLAVFLQFGLLGLINVLPLFLFLVLARLFYGCLAGAIQPAAQAYIADTTDEGSRAKGMALIASAGGLGTIIGPIFAGGLAEISPLFPMYVAGLIGLVVSIWTHFNLKEPTKIIAPNSQGILLRVFRQIFPYLLGWFVVFFVFTAIQTITVFMINNQLGITDSQEQIRTMRNAFLFMALITVVMQVGVMQIWKMEPRILLRLAFIFFGFVILVMPYVSSNFELYLLFMAMGFAVSLVIPSLTSAASLTVSSSDQGIAAGLLAAAPTFGMVFGPMSMSILYQYNATMPIYFGATLLFLTGIYFCFVKVPYLKP